MIEVVAAVALFVIIFALLMTVFRSVTRLWLPEQSSKQLQTRADTVMDILASDFYQAVADSGTLNGVTNAQHFSFMLDFSLVTLDKAQEETQVVLAFARHALPRTPLVDEEPTLRVSLDAVFYVCYSNCLSRHVYPLVRNAWDDNADDTMNALLLERKGELEATLPSLISEGWFRGKPLPQDLAGHHSLLAERCEFEVIATLPPAMVKDGTAYDLTLPLNQLSQCKADAIPDFLDVALILYDEADWNTRAALQNDTSLRATVKREYLGMPFSKRITFPAKKGGRL
ncbi:MAG: hypothetical protein FWD59_10525 [Micrococcales bacterium]|nr:hypothetical protein [Micrococcales bacterium]